MDQDRIRRKIHQLNDLIALRDDKIFTINKALAIETDPLRIFKYNHDLEKERVAISVLEIEINELESILDKDTEDYKPSGNISKYSVELRMTKVPTGYYHLLDREITPLLSFHLRNASLESKKFLCSAEILRYSDQSINQITCESRGEKVVFCLPTLIQDEVDKIDEVIKATIKYKLQDINSSEIVLEGTEAIHLLARNIALFAVYNPSNNQLQDFSDYLAAWVTPSHPIIQNFLKKVRAYHPQKTLLGYQDGGDTMKRLKIVHDQIQSIFEALKSINIGYINSIINFGTSPNEVMQRVRLPSESLQNNGANCIDGTVLFASLIMAISLNAVIFIVPGHAFVGWETWENSGKFEALETTLIDSSSFNQALAVGNAQYQSRLDNGDLDRAIFDGRGFLKRIIINDMVRKGIIPQE